MTLLQGFLIAMMALGPAAAPRSDPPLPLGSGKYVFQHRFSEHPDMPGEQVIAKIAGRRITIVNEGSSRIFPHGVIAQGSLMWHAASAQWIIGELDSDATAQDVGGCSDGPEVVDLQEKIYWTC